MSALWGTPSAEARRPLRARCEECNWEGEHHYEADADAVIYAAADSHAHNVEFHEPALREPAAEDQLI